MTAHVSERHYGSLDRQAGVVVIGRNEGERLKRCLSSIGRWPIVYVDSGSIDGSSQFARSELVDVIDLDPSTPFTAARARNTGLAHLTTLYPNLFAVQFLDGDCELAGGWLETATDFLERNAGVAVVFGRLREREPNRSIYNWLCEREWDGPIGDVQSCGGIAMMRVNAIGAVAGFREDLIAGEEPELCMRLRMQRWRICRLDAKMATHDAAIERFGQWWRRAMRSGYAFARGAALHGENTERYAVWEVRRSQFWGLLLPLTGLVLTATFGISGAAFFLVYPLQFARQLVRTKGTLRDRAALSFFQLLSRFPEAIGQLKYVRDRTFRAPTQIIEYK